MKSTNFWTSAFSQDLLEVGKDLLEKTEVQVLSQTLHQRFE